MGSEGEKTRTYGELVAQDGRREEVRIRKERRKVVRGVGGKEEKEKRNVTSLRRRGRRRKKKRRLRTRMSRSS